MTDNWDRYKCWGDKCEPFLPVKDQSDGCHHYYGDTQDNDDDVLKLEESFLFLWAVIWQPGVFPVERWITLLDRGRVGGCVKLKQNFILGEWRNAWS